jgi:hypothetical protein
MAFERGFDLFGYFVFEIFVFLEYMLLAESFAEMKKDAIGKI